MGMDAMLTGGVDSVNIVGYRDVDIDNIWRHDMPRTDDRLRDLGTSLWRASAPLTGAALLLLGLFGVSLIGLLLDPRVIAGAPAWLKPAKFAISTAIYALTLAWIFSYLPRHLRLRRFAGWATAAVFVLEVALVDIQAWRGTTSHFNIGTPLNAAIFATMGIAILFQTMAGVAVAVALWRQPFADRAIGWALRLGLAISLIGSATGGLMTRPTAAQLENARASGHISIAGAHTVGAPDGGPGVPGTGWSREHGDLRVPHYVGLHAMQALPFLALLLRRRRVGDAAATRLVVAAAASYTLLFAMLLWQALRGESLIQPDIVTVEAFAAWLVLTMTGVWIAIIPNRRSLRPDVLAY